jgi:hypothetical protein
LQSERIAAAYDLSVGMNYLHERRIVFRDLVSLDLVVVQIVFRSTKIFLFLHIFSLSRRNPTILASTTSESSRFLISVWQKS